MQGSYEISSYHLEDMESEVASLINRVSLLKVNTSRERYIKPYTVCKGIRRVKTNWNPKLQHRFTGKIIGVKKTRKRG